MGRTGFKIIQKKVEEQLQTPKLLNIIKVPTDRMHIYYILYSILNRGASIVGIIQQSI